MRHLHNAVPAPAQSGAEIEPDCAAVAPRNDPPTGWALELTMEVCAAPNRRCAANLIGLSRDAIDHALSAAQREQLLTTLQDIIAELPDEPGTELR